MANDNFNIVRFTGFSRLDWSVEEVFRLAAEKNLTDVVVIGRMPNGNLYFDNTQANVADVNWMLDKIKADLINL